MQPRSAGQNVASRYSLQGSPWSAEKASAPHVPSGRRAGVGGLEIGPTPAAVIPR